MTRGVREALLTLWQLPQAVLGGILWGWLKWRGRVVHEWDAPLDFRRLPPKGARYDWHMTPPLVLVEADINWGVSLGTVILVPVGAGSTVWFHEYGHVVQSRLLGWLYLPLVGLPSVAQWVFSRLALKVGWEAPARGYYTRYPEAWADRLGRVVHERGTRDA